MDSKILRFANRAWLSLVLAITSWTSPAAAQLTEPIIYVKANVGVYRIVEPEELSKNNFGNSLSHGWHWQAAGNSHVVVDHVPLAASQWHTLGEVILGQFPTSYSEHRGDSCMSRTPSTPGTSASPHTAAVRSAHAGIFRQLLPAGLVLAAGVALIVLVGVAQRVGWLPAANTSAPPVAVVGLTEEAALAAGHLCWCNVLPMALVPRAGAIRDTRGMVKMVANATTGEVLGVSMVVYNWLRD